MKYSCTYREILIVHLPHKLLVRLTLKYWYSQEYCCTSSSVLEENRIHQLTITVQALMQCAARLKQEHSVV